MAEREPESHGHRPAEFADELASGVVNRRDVVGVESVSQPQRVRGDADADAERPSVARAPRCAQKKRDTEYVK